MPRGRQGQLARLRAALAALERRHGKPGSISIADVEREASQLRREIGWTLGTSEIDGWLPEGCMDSAGLSEIKPGAYGDGPAALAFALLLVARSLRVGKPDHDRIVEAAKPGLLVWCWSTKMARDMGRIYGPGFATLGIDPARVLLVECNTAAETLWAMEESLASQAAAIVVGCVEAVALTPARRLALATQAHRTPGLLVTAARSMVTPATFARWRIAASPSAPHPFDPAAPGGLRFALTLERCRGTAADVARPSCIVEWSHEAHRFGVVADVADRAPAAAARA